MAEPLTLKEAIVAWKEAETALREARAALLPVKTRFDNADSAEYHARSEISKFLARNQTIAVKDGHKVFLIRWNHSTPSIEELPLLE